MTRGITCRPKQKEWIAAEVEGVRNAVQASFEAARAEPVHAKDPSLKAVEITPGKLLPKHGVR